MTYVLGQSGKIPQFSPPFFVCVCLGQRGTMSTPVIVSLCPLDTTLRGLKAVVDYWSLGRGKVMAKSPWIPLNFQSFVCRIKSNYFSNLSRHCCYESNTILFQSLIESIVSLGLQSLSMVATSGQEQPAEGSHTRAENQPQLLSMSHLTHSGVEPTPWRSGTIF